MKRLCIFSIFDIEGKIDKYIYHWLREFCKVCDYIVVVSNGCIQQGHMLSQYADQIIERANKGFDGGAYADVLTNHLSYRYLKEFDEVILCNDTCYGPFIPMQDIFDKMDSKGNDFWGIQLWDEGYARWINSFFLVFCKKVIMDREWLLYFENQIDKNALSMAEAYGKFEMGLYLWLIKKGYHYSYYAIPSDNHSMKCPDYFIEKCRFPFIKKRAFCREHYHEENLRKALALIRNKGYNLNWIIDNISRKYKISDTIREMAKSNKMDAIYLKYKTVLYPVDKSTKTPEDILKFIKKNNQKNMYIYGAGAFGSRIYQVYHKYMRNFKGFLVSEKNLDSVLEEKIYEINEIKLDESAIVIGMDKRNTAEVLKNNLIKADCVLNLYTCD